MIIAEGALAESFIDDDSRGLFHNAHEYRALYPDAPAELARYCAPRLEDGYELETSGGGLRCAPDWRRLIRRRGPATCAALSIGSRRISSRAGRRTSTIPKRRSVSTFTSAAD